MQEAVCSVGVCRLFVSSFFFHVSSSKGGLQSGEGRTLAMHPPSGTLQLTAPQSHQVWHWAGFSPSPAAAGSTSGYPSLHTGTNCSSSVSPVMHEAQGAPRGLQTSISWLWFVALKMEYDHKKCLHLLIYKLPTAIPCLSTSRWRCAVNWFMGVKSFQTTRWKMLQK